MKFLQVFVFLLITSSTFAQLPKKVNHFVGHWEYKENSGHDIWKIEEGRLVGESHRLDEGGDTLAVERMVIGKSNDILYYKVVRTSLSNENSCELIFKSKNGSKMVFVNTSSEMPYSIAYSFSFLNRNKMKIKIHLGANGGKTKLILYRI